MMKKEKKGGEPEGGRGNRPQIKAGEISLETRRFEPLPREMVIVTWPLQ